MHDARVAPTAQPFQPADDVRHAGARALAQSLRASRRDTLAGFARCEGALERLRVPQVESLNPPLWELGHVGWFQEFWIARNPERDLGQRADPQARRAAPVRAQADALYDSSQVAHARRWSLALPDADGTRADLATQLDATLALLQEAAEDDAGLYFYRLVLLHEDMHHEAALYMAQHLGVAVGDPRWQPQPLPEGRAVLEFEAGPWRLGNDAPGFAFDNELVAQVEAVPASRIDCRVLRWDEYLPFVDAGGYRQPGWWSAEGRAWLAAQAAEAPRYLRREDDHWCQWRHGRWARLDPALPACHLSAFEAEAYCRWAGRRLPTEAEWERAAVLCPGDFDWGAVWEWTASPFLPYQGFAPHPYRDYSQPWFGSRRVLRGASFMTQPRLHHPRYRNFFPPHRNDIAAGFRTCATIAAAS